MMIEIIKWEMIYLKCKVCGVFFDVDMWYKLCGYICKNFSEIKKDKKEK